MTMYVLSTMSSAIGYCFYDQPNRNTTPTAKNPVSGDIPVLRKKIRIHGGAGLPSLRSGFGDMEQDAEGKPLWTADGMVTPISDADYELLKDHHVFKKHLEKGLVKVINRDISDNYRAVKKEAAGMSSDPFALLNKDTLAKKVKLANVTTGSLEQESKYRI